LDHGESALEGNQGRLLGVKLVLEVSSFKFGGFALESSGYEGDFVLKGAFLLGLWE